MPYIHDYDRDVIDRAIAPLADIVFETGEYNYAITKLCQEFLVWLQAADNINQRGGYDARNTVIGLLECVKLEFYRREVAEYEDEKCVQNGDVY